MMRSNHKMRNIKDIVGFNFGKKELQKMRRITGAEVFLKIGDSEDAKFEKVGHNIVVDTAYVLLAALALEPADLAGGFTFIAVGVGDTSWDPLAPPPPTGLETTLENEIARVAIADKYFVDPATGEPVDYPTNVIDLIGTFGLNIAVGALDEIAVFGGNATISADSGYMVNLIRFPVKNKGAGEVFTWLFRFTF